MFVSLHEVVIYEVVPENVQAPCEQFRQSLKSIRKSMKIATNKDECNVILFYLPIVSRAGTDIEAALQKLDDFKGSFFSHASFDPVSKWCVFFFFFFKEIFMHSVKKKFFFFYRQMGRTSSAPSHIWSRERCTRQQ